jgi:hypothetical protein
MPSLIAVHTVCELDCAHCPTNLTFIEHRQGSRSTPSRCYHRAAIARGSPSRRMDLVCWIDTEGEIQIRRIVVKSREPADFDGIRCEFHRSGFISRLPRLCSDERFTNDCSGVFRTPCESRDSLSALTSTAEKSGVLQTLLGATSRSLPSAPVLAISWHCP